MDMESQKILFALSTPMEIRNECCLPSHSSPKMYLGTRFFDLSSSWGIDDRDDLLRTIHRMIDNGHAARLAGFYHRWFRYSPCEWRNYTSELNESGQAYAQFVASTAECCGEGGIKAWDYVRMGFLSRMGVLNNWLSEEESLWIQSRIHLRAINYYVNWRQYFAAYIFGRQYWQSPEDDNLPLLREFLARKEYDDSGNDMFYQLFASDDAYYVTLPWQPLADYPTCPETLKDMSDL
ncbi:DUF1266 domain-containing protein [Escherichia fergusonii]|uniref:DUF1266 domain-containing protein n=1 Tax=Escherichia fergusonii TaxID=564 RepID=UPI0024337D46|nr:DUF1266 domain-containing protein [Escherichia fergusonii]WGA36102.1 DUF1266 domain-containing protein [Escherichia fergusonii]